MEKIEQLFGEMLNKASCASYAITQPWGLNMAMTTQHPNTPSANETRHDEAVNLAKTIAIILDKALPARYEPEADERGKLLRALSLAASGLETSLGQHALVKSASEDAVACVLEIAGEGGKNILVRSAARKSLREYDTSSNYVGHAEACTLGQLAVKLCQSFNGSLEGVPVVTEKIDAVHNKMLMQQDAEVEAGQLCEVLNQLVWHPGMSGHAELPTPLVVVYIPGQSARLIPITRLHEMVITALGEHSEPRFYSYMPHYLTALKTVAEIAGASIALALPAYIPGGITGVTLVGYRHVSCVDEQMSTFGGVSTRQQTELPAEDSAALGVLSMKVKSWVTYSTAGLNKAPLRKGQVMLPPQVWWMLANGGSVTKASTSEMEVKARRAFGLNV